MSHMCMRISLFLSSTVSFSIATAIIETGGQHIEVEMRAVLDRIVFALDRREPVFVGLFHLVFVSPPSRSNGLRYREMKRYSS